MVVMIPSPSMPLIDPFVGPYGMTIQVPPQPSACEYTAPSMFAQNAHFLPNADPSVPGPGSQDHSIPPSS